MRLQRSEAVCMDGVCTNIYIIILSDASKSKGRLHRLMDYLARQIHSEYDKRWSSSEDVWRNRVL